MPVVSSQRPLLATPRLYTQFGMASSKTARQMTKAVNPKNQALWQLPDLYSFLCAWAYEGYDQEKHPALGQSPLRHGRVDWILEGHENTDAFAMMTCFGC